jgi:hypothetical protein
MSSERILLKISEPLFKDDLANDTTWIPSGYGSKGGHEENKINFKIILCHKYSAELIQSHLFP